jgi:putative inorganic carbon (hco3(-)) transporter
MEMSKVTNRTTSVWPVFYGLLFGIGIVSSCDLPFRWMLFLVSALVCVCLAIAFINQLEKTVFLSFLILLPIELGKSFFYFSPDFEGGSHELRITIPLILFLVLLCYWTVSVVIGKSKVYFDRPLHICTSIFMILSGLSIFVAERQSLSIFEFIRAVNAFLIFLYISNCINTENKLDQAIMWLQLSLIPQICVGLYQWAFKRNIGLTLVGEMELDSKLSWANESLFRIGGLIGHPNGFGLYLILTLPFCLVFMLSKDRKLVTRAISFILLCFGLFCLIATRSRASWVAFVFSGAATLSLLLAYTRALRLKHLLLGVIVLTGIATIVFSFRTVIRDRLLTDDDGSALSRIPMMVDALNVIQNNPLLGVGLNNYAAIVHKYDITGIHREWRNTAVHNLFLLIAAESGIVTLFAFLGVFLIVFKYVFLLLQFENHIPLALGLFMSVVGFLTISLVGPDYRFYPSIQREIWLIIGLAAAAKKINIDNKLKRLLQ